jgi:AmiR/NasT family two-component response regulator
VSFLVPSFGGLTAIVLHRPDESMERLMRQLERLGMSGELRWDPLRAGERADIVMVDADQGYDELLPWSGHAPPCPVIGLLRSEAPGRIAWAIERGASAFLAKPLQTSAVYPALVLASSLHAERIASREKLARAEERLRLRPVVFQAVRVLAARNGITEDAAHALLRDLAMAARQPLEQVAASLLAGTGLRNTA